MAYNAHYDLLKQAEDAIQALLAYIDSSLEKKEDQASVIDSLVNKALKIKEAMTDKATAKQVYEAVQEAMSTNLKQVAEYIEASPVVIKFIEGKERLKKELYDALQRTQALVSQGVEKAKTDFTSFVETAKSRVEEAVAQGKTAVISKVTAVKTATVKFATKAREGVESVKSSFASFADKAISAKDKAESLFRSGVDKVMGIKRGIVNAYQTLRQYVSMETAKWLMTKAVQGAAIFGALRFVWKRKELIGQYITDKMVEWKERAKLSFLNFCGRIKTNIHQFVARKVNSVVDFFGDYLPKSITDAVRMEVPPDFVAKEYEPPETHVRFTDVLRGKKRETVKNEKEAQATFDSAVSKAASSKTKANPSNVPLEDSRGMVDAITSPTNSVTSLVSSLFQSGKDALGRAGKSAKNGMRKVAEGMATSGIGKYFKNLTSSFMSAVNALSGRPNGVGEEGYNGEPSVNPTAVTTDLASAANRVTGGTFNQYTKWCGRGVANILGEAGYPGFPKPDLSKGQKGWRPAGANGGNLDVLLAKRGWVQVPTNEVREGDVRIGKNRGAGHSEVYAGGWWYSDTRQKRSITPTSRYSSYTQWRYTGGGVTTSGVGYSSPPDQQVDTAAKVKAAKQGTSPYVLRNPKPRPSLSPALSRATTPPIAPSAPVKRDPIYTDETWKHYKELSKPQPPSPPPMLSNDKAKREVLIKSPYSRGMSSVIISNYIG
jgi:hypothetical protein